MLIKFLNCKIQKKEMHIIFGGYHRFSKSIENEIEKLSLEIFLNQWPFQVDTQKVVPGQSSIMHPDRFGPR